MFTNTCKSCGKRYALKDVRIDEHWNTWSLKPSHCHCPYCDIKLDNVRPSSVDLIRSITTTNITILVIFFALWAFGIATATLSYIAPSTIIIFGIFLAKSSKLNDHRIIGLVLAIIFSFVLVWLNLDA